MERALVDTAAGQALIGKGDLEILVTAFRKRGYHVHYEMGGVTGQTASGIGGKTEPIGRAWVPISIANYGFVEFLILPH
eukprot:916551-Pyramimonas_sp.AAC.1